MSSVSSGVAANQILKNAIAVSSLPNGSPAASGSPSPLQQSLQSSLQSSSNAVISRPSGAPHSTSTTISLSAINPSLVITPNKTTGMTPKPGQTLLIATTKDGPMIVQPSATPLTHANSVNSVSSEPSHPSHTTSAGTASSSVPTTSSIVTIASRNLVSSGAGANAQQSNLMQQLVSNHSNQIQFQLVTNVNTSRPQTPTANIANRALAPRVVQLPPNVRLTPQLIRPGNSGPFTGQVSHVLSLVAVNHMFWIVLILITLFMVRFLGDNNSAFESGSRGNYICQDREWPGSYGERWSSARLHCQCSSKSASNHI